MVLSSIILVCMPFLIDMVYDLNPPCDFFDIELSKADILNYYAQFLSLLATIVLGAIAVFQTYKGQNEYSYAAEPPVQFRLSHLSRRSEPL